MAMNMHYDISFFDKLGNFTKQSQIVAGYYFWCEQGLTAR